MTISNHTPGIENDDLRAGILDARKVLFVGAHPDDIEYYCGGLVYMLRERGAEVIFAIATKGGKGYRSAAKELLERIRVRNQMHSARILGGVRVVFFPYPDKNLPNYIGPLADDLKALITTEKPDLIFAWDPDHIFNPHPDHQAAADATRLIGAGTNTCYYGTHEPNVWVGFGEEIFRAKLRSLRAHRTETPWPVLSSASGVFWFKG